MARPAMIKRSGQVCAHSAPMAPAWNFCSKIVQRLASTDTNMNGAIAVTLRQGTRPDRHQTQRTSTTGSITTEGLLTVARTKKSRDKATNKWRCRVRRIGRLEGAPAPRAVSSVRDIRVFGGQSSHFKK